jgi:hypothetical protein
LFGVRALPKVAGCALATAVAAALAPGCSLGNGTGMCTGELDVPSCWSGHFDLHPNFFAAVPQQNGPALQIRIQNGGDYESFSDGLTITVLDLHQVRGDPAPDGTPRPSLLGQPLVVTLPPNVVPPGVPVMPVTNPSIVEAALYLERTCRTQNVALYAVDAVSGVNGDGSCSGAQAPVTCPPVATGDAGTVDAAVDGGAADASGVADGGSPRLGTGQSTITFTSLFDGNPSEANAAQRLIEGTFELYLADPREICSGASGAPPPCRGHLTGSFRFYFERGRPAQPFP